jgi:hypothetical protein
MPTKPSDTGQRGISSRIREKINEKKQEAKEKINPFSKTNQQARQERRVERQTEQRAEREAYRKERAHQIEERGKRTAQREYAPPSRGRTSSIRRSAGPIFVPVNAQDPIGVFGSNKKPKPRTPSKTTTVTTGNKTIRITEKVDPAEEQKKKKPQWQFKDPLSFDGF